MLQMFHLFQTYVASVLYGYCICCKRMIQLFHMVSLCCSMCCYPRARGHARAHPALLISVIRASSNSRMCTQRAVNTQMTEHSLVKVHAHAERQSQPAPNGPCTTTGTDAMLPSSLVCSWTRSTHMLLPLDASHPIVGTELMSFIGS
jgi:hypothetical protein